MDPSSERELRDLRDPVVVAAFEGWNDAGSAASAAVDHLAETCDAELAFALDPDDFYDFQVNRPEVELDEDGQPEPAAGRPPSCTSADSPRAATCCWSAVPSRTCAGASSRPC